MVGRSGAGKSTLLRCINGLESYDEGSLQALINLTGAKDQILPHEGKNIEITLSPEVVPKPLFSEMARTLKTDFLILGGEMEHFRQNVLGSVTINVTNADYTKITEFLNARQLSWKVLLPFAHVDHAIAEEEE